MPRLSRTPYAILGALSHGPKSGYDISRSFERETMFFWSESYGQIYPTLKKLRDQGLVEMERDSRDAGPDRKVYSLTDAGRAQLREWLAQPTHRVSMRDEAMLKLTVTTPDTHTISLAALEQMMRELGAILARIDAQEDQITGQDISESERIAQRLTVDWSRRYHQAKLDWCESAKEALQEGQSEDTHAAPRRAAKR